MREPQKKIEKNILVSVGINPLSVNKCWQGRRFKTKDYLDYEEELLYLLPKKETIKGFVEVEIIFTLNSILKSDIDNFCKPLLDILVKKNYIEDDRKIMRLSITKQKGNNVGMCISIKTLLEELEK